MISQQKRNAKDVFSSPSFLHPEVERSNIHFGSLLGWAKQLYILAMHSVAHGDLTAIEPFVAPAAFAEFECLVQERRQQRLRWLVHLRNAEALDFGANQDFGPRRTTDVRIRAEMLSMLVDEGNNLAAGDATRFVEVQEVWTFERGENYQWLLAFMDDDE
jgi:predicted lipid-binding transport protein (Tim44 family)